MVYNCTTCPRATPRHPFCVSPPGFNPSLRDYKSLAKYAPPCPNLLCCSTVTSTLKSTCRLNCTAALVVVEHGMYSGGYLLLPFELPQEQKLHCTGAEAREAPVARQQPVQQLLHGWPGNGREPKLLLTHVLGRCQSCWFLTVKTYKWHHNPTKK